MKAFICLLLAIVLCEARPRFENPRAMLAGGIENFVIGGSNVAPGTYPWQLSQQRLGGSWSHSCGASLLNTRYALSAAHCIDGAAVANIRVICGLNDRSNTAGTQTINLSSQKMHEQYQIGNAAFPNDIAILTLSTLASLGGNVGSATLPANNNNLYAGTVCNVSGWGRTGTSNALPNILQHAQTTVLSTADCQSRMAGVGGATIWANHICVYESSNTRGVCNGDSGGPLNCPGGSNFIVVGVTSWVVANGAGNCLMTYPQVYTRVGPYLGWIGTNTP